ncbi:3'(2'),5'-bisphosphate nucleotidase CysQ [Candidiatus Paracoxiella cheracis]|uniref:3'(2'),5'-bisphosphate nucleotidase CysQ n=1 Tax=Candidiatus Paracoxiella cheracis TaxID=3405120 RepID=UPI003BF4D537
MGDEEWMQWLKPVILLAKEAGAGILNYYGQSSDQLNVSRKQDNTVLTEADLSAHEIIQTGLKQLTPDIPLVSEEDVIAPYSTRSQWSRYWLVDPLDGTRGFIENRDEFTVNIALIQHRRPVVGIVYAPVMKLLYFAVQGEGAYKQIADQDPEAIRVSRMNWQSFRVLLGHYLHSSRLLNLFKDIHECHIIRLNSSLKFCWIAEGRGDIYPRFGETSEWDTAASQCILEEAGGVIVDFDGEALQYNTKDSLVNPPFVAMGDPTQAAKVITLIKEKRRQK